MSKIEKILYNEMKDLLNRMENDFENNYNNKKNNWILDKFNNNTRAEMVFVSSFESKYGNMFESISQEIAKIQVLSASLLQMTLSLIAIQNISQAKVKTLSSRLLKL